MNRSSPVISPSEIQLKRLVMELQCSEFTIERSCLIGGVVNDRGDIGKQISVDQAISPRNRRA